jgi:intracellular sulfur oxidation DsrE/DsrF family protein
MSTRKDFLAAGSLLAALTPTLADAATPASPEPTFVFDQTRFNEILSKDAKHRQCFGAMKLADGGPLEQMQNSIRAYNAFLKEGPGAMHAVAVLYHGAAIGFAMNDAVWNDYLIPLAPHAPDFIRADLGSAKRGAGNPYKDLFTKVVANGASFFVCHNAILGFSDMLADTMKIDKQKAHAAIMAGILPGGLVVPAGVMAINACQEAKFTYIAT